MKLSSSTEHLIIEFVKLDLGDGISGVKVNIIGRLLLLDDTRDCFNGTFVIVTSSFISITDCVASCNLFPDIIKCFVADRTLGILDDEVHSRFPNYPQILKFYRVISKCWHVDNCYDILQNDDCFKIFTLDE